MLLIVAKRRRKSLMTETSPDFRQRSSEVGESKIRYTGWPNKNGTVDTVDFPGLCSNQQLFFFTLAE